MSDYREGVKRDVAEVKFLIHDLRVERFIDEVIHFHVTLDTDLEIYGIDAPRAVPAGDLAELRSRAAALRRAFGEYSESVRALAAPEAVLAAGNAYITAIHDLCGLVLHRLWAGIDEALLRLPADSRSVRSRSHHRNTVRWLCGVYYRIEHFWAERRDEDVTEEFDLAADLDDFTRNVVYGYVTEKSAARVELRLERLDRAVLRGNRHRFRRMYFNLIMNAVDAMGGKKVGMIAITTVVDGDRVVLAVRDDGSGMPADKVRHLLADRESLDGDLHSLGFVFVRQTVADFGGALAIDSEPGAGTTVTVTVPHLVGAPVGPRRRSLCEAYDLRARNETRDAAPAPPITEDKQRSCGHVVYTDYQRSDADPPGSIFAISVDEQGTVDLFAHKPYERFWNIGHEDLLPMLFEATVRGRLEEDDDGRPTLILKAPQNVREYFEFKEVADAERDADTYTRMVHDEYVRIARVLIDTGLPKRVPVHLTGAGRFFAADSEIGEDPAPAEVLAGRPLHRETDDGSSR